MEINEKDTNSRISRKMRLLIFMLITLIASVWGVFFPGAWAEASEIGFLGDSLSTTSFLLLIEIFAMFFLLLGMIRDWNIKINDYFTIKSREFFLLGSLIIILGSFAFNGLDIIEFFLYYYELFIIIIYYLIGLTLIPTFAAILLGICCLLTGYFLSRKKEDITLARLTIPFRLSSNLLIIGVVSLASAVFLWSIFQPNYVGTFGDPDNDGILRTIQGLVFSDNIVNAMTSFYLDKVIYLYPIIIFFCGILTFHYAMQEPSHSILTTHLKESLEAAFPKITRFLFIISGIVFLIVVSLLALLGIEWYIGLDTSQATLYDIQVDLFKIVLSGFTVSIVLILIVFIPKVVRPFLDARILRYAARRMLSMIPMFIGISIISYALMASTGNPVDLIISRIGTGRNRDIVYANLMRVYGLNAPIQNQWFNWFFHFIMGDMGNSIQTGVYVAEAIGTRIQPTLEISIIPLILALALSIPLGIYAALKQYSWQDNSIAIFVSFGLSIPIFLLIILCIIAFGYYLPWLPASGRQTAFVSAPGVNLAYVDLFFDTYINRLFTWAFWDSMFHLIIPIFAITIISLALYVRLIRSGYLEIIQQDYILSAQAYGFRDRTIIFRHALKNVLIPIVTYIGLSIGGLLGGAPLTETTLSWPGLGQYGILSIQGYDYPVVMGLIMITAVLILFANLLTDIIYSVIDPRVAI